MKRSQRQRRASVYESQMATVPDRERNQNKSSTEALQGCEERLVPGGSWRWSLLPPSLLWSSGFLVLFPKTSIRKPSVCVCGQSSRQECECGKGILLTYKWMTAKILSSAMTKTSVQTELIILTGLWWNVSDDSAAGPSVISTLMRSWSEVKAQRAFHDSLCY